MPTDDNLGTPPPAPAPAPAAAAPAPAPAPVPAVPAPAAAPAPAPAATPTAIDPIEFERLKTHKVEQDRELEKSRKAIADEKKARADAEQKLEAAKKLFFGDGAPADPAEALKQQQEQIRKQQETTRQAEFDSLRFRGDLSSALLSSGLVVKDNDPGYLFYRIEQDKELTDLKAEPAKLLERLKERKLVLPVGATGPAPAPMPNAATPAGSSGTNPETVGPKFANVKTGDDLRKLSFSDFTEFADKYPKRFEELQNKAVPQLRRAS